MKIEHRNCHLFCSINQKNYFVKHNSNSTHTYSEANIKRILEFLIDSIYVVFRDQVFQLSSKAYTFTIVCAWEENINCCGLNLDI